MRRIATTLATAALAATPLILTATPAEAHGAAPGYILYHSYTHGDACASSGYAGQQAGQWDYYYCDEVYPASWDGPGQYDLYVHLTH
ncbi:hypothetical protein GCM10009839_67470 [Catenulispora yoronensis]|uniref:Uncharacterized protein n=1 Tax=Catenulispora yoronensis TaxID=450799 RepID=A0ABN2V498_9ACTN